MSGPCLSSSVAGRPLRPATRHSHGGPLPRHLADRPRAPQKAYCYFSVEGRLLLATCGINSPFGELSPTFRQIAHVLRTRAPLNKICIATNLVSFDLHVLSTPPAFVLSQNQTLREKFVRITAKSDPLRHSLHRPAVRQPIRKWPLNFKSEINGRTHYPAFAECVFCCIKRSEFCQTGKPESGCQITTARTFV